MSENSPEVFCLGSSSSGNSYIFKFYDPVDPTHFHQIMVEAGFPYKELIMRALKNGAPSPLESEALLVTHLHHDHSAGAHILNDRGIQCFASESTLKDSKVDIAPNRFNTLHDWQPIYIAPQVMVLPFYVEHDAPESMGFIIRDEMNGDNILFINDSRSVKRDLSSIPIDLAFVECNYLDQSLHIEYSKAKKENDIPLVKRYERIYNSHMGLYGTRKLLKSLNLSRCRAIFLMHLSDKNAREFEMRTAIGQDFPNIPIYICKKYGGFS